MWEMTHSCCAAVLPSLCSEGEGSCRAPLELPSLAKGNKSGILQNSSQEHFAAARALGAVSRAAK